MREGRCGYRSAMPTWSVVETELPTDGSRAELICNVVAAVARRGGGLQEALHHLIPLALGRWDLVELALRNCTEYLKRHPEDPVWRRTSHLLERALTTGIFHP